MIIKLTEFGAVARILKTKTVKTSLSQLIWNVTSISSGIGGVNTLLNK